MPDQIFLFECIKCKTLKPSIEFPPRKASKSGLSHYCRKCYAEFSKNWRYSDHGRKKTREYRELETVLGKRRRNASKYRKGEAGRAAAKRLRLRQGRNPANARKAIFKAIANGKIIKPISCSKCNSDKMIEAHHYLGYEREHWFDVQWLCRKCHSKTYTKLAWTGSGPSNFQSDRLHS